MKSNTTTAVGRQIHKQTDVTYINITLFLYDVQNKMKVSAEGSYRQMFQV
jgi:hypothetical protein